MTAPGPPGASRPGPLPLVIGVTGHRDLRQTDCDPLKERVRRILAELQARYRHTPLLLLSPLAEGADRLVARVALEEGARLVVPLPLPRAVYEKDFQLEGSLAEFRELLGRAETWFELPLLDGARAVDVERPGPARDRQYAQLGAYIVRHSQVLLALWDGDEAEITGGTSHVVRFQLHGVPAPFAPAGSLLDPVETGPVYQIVTPRARRPAPIGEPFAVRTIFPGGALRAGPTTNEDPGRRFDRVLARTDGFNRDAIRLAARIAEGCDRSRAKLLQGVDSAALREALAPSAALFAVADSLALYFKARTGSALPGLFVLGFLAIALFSVYAHLGKRSVFLALYLIVLCVAYGWYLWAGAIASPPALLQRLVGPARAGQLWAWRGDYKSKYLDYRALAEGLRVQFFWRLVGVENAVADHYLRKQRTELDWVRNATRVWDLRLGGQDRGAPPLQAPTAVVPDYGFVLSRWVDDQRDFYRLAVGRDRRDLRAKEQLVPWLFLAGIALAAFLVGFAWLPHEEYAWAHDPLIVIAGLLPAAAALLEGYAEKRALSEEAKQYRRMWELFAHASDRARALLEAQKIDEVVQLLRDLGTEALAENGDWVLLHRARPIEVPRGG